MSDITQKLGIVVDVQNREAKRAIEELEGKWKSYGKALSDATGKGAVDFGKLLTQQQKAIKSFDDLINRSDSAAKKQDGIWDKITGKLVSAEFYAQAVGKAFDLAGKYLAGAFARAKIDPALAGINELRLATEAWTADLERGLDRILNKAAKAITTLAHGFAVMDVEAALRERARRNGTTVAIERQRYVDEQYASGLALGGFGGTEEGHRGIAGALLDAGDAAVNRGRGLSNLYDRARGTPRTYGGPETAYQTVGGQLAGVVPSGGWGETSAQTVGGALNSFGGRYGGSGMYAAANGNMPNVEAQQRQIEALNAALQDQTTAIGGSLAAITGGLQAAVAAAIDGNESMGKAFLKGAGAVLKGIALQATGMAAFEAAKALVFPWAAGLHLTAAAKLAGVAALTGVLAAGAGAAAGGGGGGGGYSAQAGSTYVAPHSERSAGGGDTYIVNINGFVGTDKNAAIAAISKGLGEARAARRIRTSSVVKYGSDSSYEAA